MKNKQNKKRKSAKKPDIRSAKTLEIRRCECGGMYFWDSVFGLYICNKCKRRV